MNLLYHPHAFTSLEDAFDPASNARAAAAFLHTLQASGSGWADTVGRYHSADPARGIPYASMVMASWHGGADMPAPPLSQVALLVRVYVPGGMAAGLRTASMAAGLPTGPRPRAHRQFPPSRRDRAVRFAALTVWSPACG